MLTFRVPHETASGKQRASMLGSADGYETFDSYATILKAAFCITLYLAQSTSVD